MASLISLLTGCTPLQQYRTGYTPYPPAQTAAGARTNTIEAGTNYLLGFVEFDDHGWLWNSNQMKAVVDRVSLEDTNNGVLIVVFAHGWKHNASWNDGNVNAFRAVLSELQELETTNSAQHVTLDGTPLPLPPRKVVGVYLGWRGLSQTWWGLKELTFWERKRTAHSVGQGAVSDILVELEEIRKRSRIVYQEQETNHLRQPTMLVVVGHSFGGAVIYSALAPLLQEHLIDVIDSEGKPKPPRGFGDLVVLVNPAFEAARFEVLKRSSDARGYVTNQAATLAIFTSKADWATKIAFKIGRIVSTVFEKHRKDQDQYGANITAIGHYNPYITHDLNVAPPKPGEPPKGKSPKVGSPAYTGRQTIKESSDQVHVLRHKVRAAKSKPKEQVITEDSTYQFSQSRLVPRDKIHKPHDPIYVVSVDPKIIPSHDEFETQAFITFLREFIFAFTGNPQNP
jgi:hypothetical protein